MPRDGSSTRNLIQATAMEMFVDQGYDKTSLREIADRVGVTKAALYYHFRTKDDIVRAALEDYAAGIAAVAGWLETQRPGADRDAGFVDRMLDLSSREGLAAMRFAQRNPTVMARQEHGEQQVAALQRIVSALAGNNPTTEAVLRATLAYGAVVLATSEVADSALLVPGTAEQRRAAARSVALDLLGALPH